MTTTTCSFPRRLAAFCAAAFFILSVAAHAQQPLVINRDGQTISLEPYAPNIIRVTLSLQKDQATAAPGYGFVGAPAFQGWARTQANGDDVYSSPRMIVTVEGKHPSPPPPLTIVDISNSSTAPRPARTSPSPRRMAKSFSR